MSSIFTPVDVERRLAELSKELNEASDELKKCEYDVVDAKVDYELAVASARESIRESGLMRGTKITVQELDDKSLLACHAQYRRYNTADAVVRYARSNVARIKTQVDIARSVGTSVRLSMETV